MRVLFLSNQSGHIEWSCAGTIADFASNNVDANILIMNAPAHEVTELNEMFMELGVNDENILIGSLDWLENNEAYSMLIENQIKDILPEVIFIKDPLSGEVIDQFIWEIVVRVVPDEVSIIIFRGEVNSDFMMHESRENMIIPLSEDAREKRAKLFGYSGSVETFRVQRIVYKI